MSMQLLYRSLRDVVKAEGPLGVKTVANVAYQMIDALQHVHSHRLVHRDIKPDNIMLQSQGSWKLCLIDFGLARPLPSSRVSAKLAMYDGSISSSDEPAYVFGTLPFASLHAHEKDPQLAFHDDFESLAYTLIWLLRGNLPWSHYAKCGTRVGRIRQVLAQKKRHTGSTMAIGLPAEFGELVDYARSLSLDKGPDHEEWRSRFKEVELAASDDTLMPARSSLEISTIHPEPPIETGQIVLVRLDSSVTADGYTIRAGHESSFIPDPIVVGPEWSTVYRPAVVARVEWDKRAQKYFFFAIAISQESDGYNDAPTPVIPIVTASSATSDTSPKIHIKPEWPLAGSHFYVFMRPVKFYCLPSQERVHSTWRITNSDCDALLNALTPPPDTPRYSQHRQNLKSLDPDTRRGARMKSRDGACKLYAHVQPLALMHFGDDSIDWFSKRAWFDECIKVTRHQSMNNGVWWTGAWFPAAELPKAEDLLDSYYKSDYSMWEPQSERRKSITLMIDDEDVEGRRAILGGLTKIVALEQEHETGTEND
ncbi:kinase [Rhizoctonia solani AG-3 Rhs1AP]|uniref:non-specific serine/threonine protein kinase n=1 Tax=Rhizoctonia solani AG-3 Rhs1AP TaxID=1086054 RepID=A0A0A1UKG3_9AGAM|nr:kinase [Rhizoctonia solani AG-3 Rhs1AP]